MSQLAQWYRANDEYLQKALLWLRLRLTHLNLVNRGEAGEVAVDEEVTPASLETINKLADEISSLESSPPLPALVLLARLFNLSRFERDVLLLCAAMEFDTRIAGLCARAQDDANKAYPTFALALALFDEPSWDALSPERPLRYWRMLEINQPGAQPLTTSALRADERIVNYVKGLNYLDDRLPPLLSLLDTADETIELPPSQQASVELIINRLQQPWSAGELPLVQLLGVDTLSKQLIAQHAAAALGLHLYRLPAGSLPAHIGELETLARLWQRESVLLPLALYVDNNDTESTAAAATVQSSLNRFLSRVNSVRFLDTREVLSGLERGQQSSIILDVEKPTRAEQLAAWTAALERLADRDAAASSGQLASQFNLSIAAIQQFARAAISEIPPGVTNGDRKLDERLWATCLLNTRPRLDALAQRLDPKATWDDIVLPVEPLGLLRQIAAQVGQRSKVYDDWGFHHKMNRGLGISALFAGESGTGKTMAAEVIANELRLNLYRIDLSAVVSKYIGETEKNLRCLFDAAEDGSAILFFDEADALFGKRSEVKDSHDRYANIEINYLLQRMEAYRGLAILATNMKSALDPAFLRRLRFIVNFAFPAENERLAMWRKVFPVQTPIEGIDFPRLAKLNVTGGSIHNIALCAAFLAAQADTPVTMPLVMEAARAEFRKLERPINEADFRVIEAVRFG